NAILSSILFALTCNFVLRVDRLDEGFAGRGSAGPCTTGTGTGCGAIGIATAGGCFWLYSTINSNAPSNVSIGSHVASESGYPFHRTRYWSILCLPYCRLSRIRSTSHSFSPPSPVATGSGLPNGTGRAGESGGNQSAI